MERCVLDWALSGGFWVFAYGLSRICKIRLKAFRKARDVLCLKSRKGR